MAASNKYAKKNPSTGKRKLEMTEIASVSAVLQDLKQRWKGDGITFQDCPGLSGATQRGLEAAGFVHPTEIQRESLPYALNGMDILGAAKTGSGKTLAFLIPILEDLWRNRWSPEDGLGALIISPTRELALQIFNVLKRVGCQHEFSAALLIGGGGDAKWERARLGRTNIVIGTPGRILQHMDQAPYFSVDSLRILVLDEADRILDLGFSAQITAIVENLQNEHQTLLFSATQTKSVQDLARLSVRDPVYVSVHEHATHATPDQLSQSYVVCKDEDKLNFLWSFVRNHVKKKVLVFLATCKQVRFVHDSFRRLRPGQTVLALHGFMNPKKRVDVFDRFCRNTTGAVLLATDVASRGLDFPLVDWVIQMDCPPEVSDYIHRCGRTARYDATGQALLLLTPRQEIPMLDVLAKIKIPEMNKIEVNPRKMQNIQGKLQGLLAADPNLKLFAQRSFVAYIRSITMMKNKEVFDTKSIDLDGLTRSYGLVVRPRLRFMNKPNRVEKDSRTVLNMQCSRQVSAGSKVAARSTSSSTATSLIDHSASHEGGFNDHEFDQPELDDFMSIKRPNHDLDSVDDGLLHPGIVDHNEKLKLKKDTKEKPKDSLYKLARKLQRKRIIVNQKIRFKEEDEPNLDEKGESCFIVNANYQGKSSLEMEQQQYRMVTIPKHLLKRSIAGDGNKLLKKKKRMVNNKKMS